MAAHAGRGTVRLSLRRAMVPAAATRPPVLRPRYDCKVDREPLWSPAAGTLEPSLRPVLPLEISYDAKEDVLVLCRTGRAHLLDYAIGKVGLLHSDLNKYWVGDALQEVYTDVLKQHRGMDAAAAAEAARDETEFGKDMDAALQTFQRFGSSLFYELGTCCVRDKNRAFVLVDGLLYSGFTLVSRLQTTGYALWTVPKIAFECGAFKVDKFVGWSWDVDYILPDEAKFRAANAGASDQEVFKATQVKTTVEIDRSLLNQGKLVIFMPPTSAWNKFEVYVEMLNAGHDMKGLELKLLFKPPVHRLQHGAWYALREMDTSSFDSQVER